MITYKEFNKHEYRNALGKFGTGVAIVSTKTATNLPVGVTINSFNSVSLDPPIVLWSLNKQSPSLQAFDDTGKFVIHVLSQDQVDLSKRFSSRIEDKFSNVGYEFGQLGVPLIQGCSAIFECTTWLRQEVGDHILFLGLVENFHSTEKEALLYYKGRYAVGAELETDSI
jgi:flavin reductase (DIM6/NTAB) family NADH-FMN oxidoreductase RutF